MTRDEAIEILKNLISYESGCAIGAEGFRLELCRDRVEALDIAIKALEAEPKLRQALEQEKGAYNALVANVHCEDAISRQAVLDVVNFEDKWLFDAKSYNENTKIAFSSMKSKISEMPSVTPQPCEDAISRQMAIDELKDIKDLQGRNLFAEKGLFPWNVIAQLPSVTPQQRTGRWIINRDSTGRKYGECSECMLRQYVGLINYCPSCGCAMKVGLGAKMEVEE